MNIGKLIVLIFCCITVVPMLILVGSAIFIMGAEGVDYSDTALGNLTNLNE